MPVGGLDARALDVRGPRLLVRLVRAHQLQVQVGGVDFGGAGRRVERGVEQVAAQLRGVEVAAGDAVALLGDDLAVLVQVAGRVHGPLSGEPVVGGVELVADAPVPHRLVGAVRGDDRAVEPVQERGVLVDALAVRACAVHLDDHILDRVDGLQRVGHLVGGLGHLVDQLGRGVLDHVAVGDLDDRVGQDHLVGLAEERLVDGRILQRVMRGVRRVGLQVLGLRVALDGLAGRGHLRVHGPGVHVGDAIPDLDVERLRVVLAVGAQHLDLRGVDVHVLVVVVVADAEPPHLVRLVFLPGVEGDDVLAGVAHHQGLAVDADRRIALLGGLVVGLGRLEVGRQVEHLVRGGEAVVQGEHPLVVDLVVAGRVLRHGALETDLDARVGARLPFFEQRLVGDGQLEQVLGLVPLGVVLGFRDHLAGREVHHLDGLLVRGQVLVIRVGERDLADRVGEACGQVRLGGQLVFDLLAGVDDLAVHARLVAALGPFADHVLDDGRHVAADLRLVGLLDGPVQGLRAAVRQARAVRAGRVAGRGAERQLVAGLLAEILAHLACALAGREADRAGDEQRDLLGGFQSFQTGQVLLVRGGGGLRAGDGDRPLGGHVLARVHDVRDGRLLVGRRVRLVHAHGFHVVRLEDVGGLRPIVREGERGGRLGEVGADGAVDHGAYLVAVEEHMVVRARLVRLVRVDDRGPLAVLVEDPAFVGVRLERGELARFGVHGRVLVPRVVGLVLDRIALGLGDGHVEAELQRVLVGHEPALPHGAHRVRLRVEADGPLRAHVLVVVGRVDELEIVDRVGDALRVDHIADRGPVAARARVEPDGGAVGHAVRARARRDRLMGLVGRYGLERERLRRLTVGRVHGRAHVALLGDLHVEPVRALGPAFFHAEVGGRERGAVRRPGGRHGHALRGFRGLVESCRVAVVVQAHVGRDVRVVLPAGRGDDIVHGGVGADARAVRRGLRGHAQLVGGHAARLVLVEHDDRDRGPARVAEDLFGELVHGHARLIIKGIRSAIGVIVIVKRLSACNSLPVRRPVAS